MKGLVLVANCKRVAGSGSEWWRRTGREAHMCRIRVQGRVRVLGAGQRWEREGGKKVCKAAYGWSGYTHLPEADVWTGEGVWRRGADRR